MQQPGNGVPLRHSTPGEAARCARLQLGFGFGCGFEMPFPYSISGAQNAAAVFQANAREQGINRADLVVEGRIHPCHFTGRILAEEKGLAGHKSKGPAFWRARLRGSWRWEIQE